MSINCHLAALHRPVFGLFNRHGQVSTEIVPDGRKATLQAIIHGRVGMDRVLYSDGW